MSEFQPGDRVVLRRLGPLRHLNHHVGRVVDDVWTQGSVGERVQVRLHSALWGGGRDDLRLVAVRPEHLDACVVPTRATLIGTPDERVLLALLKGGCCLPDGLPQRVLEYLCAEPVKPDAVVVTAASSSNDGADPEAVLVADDERWWISARVPLPDAHASPVFSEWLEFSLGDRPRILSYVGIKIPPMPWGPLSVREFRVEQWVADADGDCSGWKASCPLHTLDRAEVQEFALPEPIQASRVRLVFTRAAGELVDCIGLFEVRFR